MSTEVFASLVAKYLKRYSSVPPDIVKRFELVGNQAGALTRGYGNANHARQTAMVLWIQAQLAKPAERKAEPAALPVQVQPRQASYAGCLALV